MASIVKVKNGYRSARWRTPYGASRSKTFDRKVDAERHLTSVAHWKLTGDYVDSVRGAGDVRRAHAPRGRHRNLTDRRLPSHLRSSSGPTSSQRWAVWPIGSIAP